MLIAGRGLDAERDLVRFAARIAALSVATDPLPLEPLEPLPDLLRVGSTGAVPRTDGAVVAERTEEAILRVGTLASSHQPGPSWPCDWERLGLASFLGSRGFHVIDCSFCRADRFARGAALDGRGWRDREVTPGRAIDVRPMRPVTPSVEHNT
jgi:hypothetical protein